MREFDFDALREIRASDPNRVATILSTRARRALLPADGKLLIIAADHPARGALGIRDHASAMADRYELLGRLATALTVPGVDGVLGTPDIIDDLALLGLLENKVVVGSLNRGGLQGASFEFDDRQTAYSVDAIADQGLDFAKLLLRINYDDPATADTLEWSGAAVTAAAERRIPLMVEPFISTRSGSRVHNDLSPDAVIKSIAIAAGLGASSAYTWLKLPVVADMDRVMAATTLPTLLLGGDPPKDMGEVHEKWIDALSLPGVRGLVVGRALLYPSDGDVAGAVAKMAEAVHG